MDAVLPTRTLSDDLSYAIEGLEQSLPYTMACLQENFRINPVFTMPLPRKVAIPGGMDIDGHAVPQNVSIYPLSTRQKPIFPPRRYECEH